MISQARVVVEGGGMMAFAKLGSPFVVELLEDRRGAAVLPSDPAYDPGNERLRA